MSNSQKAFQLGQSLWYDNIQRKLLENGELKGMIDAGLIRGVTSNPSIFNNAIAKTNDYDDDLIPLAKAGKSALEIFEVLAVEDIRAAADLFLPLYEESKGLDGYVSLEVNPELANDTEGTCEEAARLWGLVDRPNTMIKIPATKAGLPAIRRTIAAGINVNVTLIFSVARHLEVMEAYLAGLEDRKAAGGDISNIASVASFFISRIDSLIDSKLEALGDAGTALLGKVAIANAKVAYEAFKEVFGSERFNALQSSGARLQRPLWASTSTKNPTYPDTLYIDELLGSDTVNTVPPKTLDAFNDHGAVAATLEANMADAKQVLSDLAAVGVSLDEATQVLEDEGVQKFAEAFVVLLDAVEGRRVEAL